MVPEARYLCRELLDILEACPMLKTLSYSATRLPSLGADHTVSLPYLRHLELSAELGDISQVIAHLTLPEDVHLSLKPKKFRIEHADPPPSLLRPVFPQEAGSLPALGRMRHIFMQEFSDGPLTVYATADRKVVTLRHRCHGLKYCFPITGALEQRTDYPSLYMSFVTRGSTWHALFPHIMSELSAGIFPPSAESLNIRVEMYDVQTHHWEQVLAVFPGLLHFELIGCGVKSKLTLFHALTPSAITVPCPQLRELILRVPYNKKTAGMLSSLEDALRRRLEQGSRLSILRLVLRRPATITSAGKLRLPDPHGDAQTKLECLVVSVLVDKFTEGL